ncbi:MULTISPECIES: dienelactone hydrolase family protein [Sphingobium]|uniref:Carboxymethylenebutenolidase n=2 Tax=Sphingobium TaxID=165695 RepID=A0A8E0WNH6_9SPHN|nr:MULTISPECIES: dienelactone hydrolase family protein [Sphingobium]EPR12540.1 hypothetical protein M527_01280 [Sphingobium indicum IP26]AMK20758.1 carboxymethylenebutenolidase [Sphingobium sp. MI1205]AMK21401.1 carboxymethylenebutenolidase [Sphingobium sp. TKS]EQB03534.1 hypothetical protein L286_12445 [Sphingobium sp. HDIP04]EQB15481.1 hypothetical protein RLDS_11235 [Sphingobium lactosutens DS20]
MTNFNYSIDTSHGPMDGYITAQPGQARPGIVLLPEIFGINGAMRLAADQFSQAGFAVLAPDLFSQVESRVELGYTEADRERAIAIWQKMDDSVALADSRAAINALAADPRCNGEISVLGFCLGGKYALLLAAQGGILASVSFYPVRVNDYQEQLITLKCPTQVHVGDDDAHIPPPVLDVLTSALSSSETNELHLYAGAGHGFFNSVRSFGYSPRAAESAFTRAVAFLNRHQGT